MHPQENFNLEISNQKNEYVALEHPLSTSKYAHEMQNFVASLIEFANLIQVGQNFFETLFRQAELISNPSKTPSGKLTKKMENNSLLNFAVSKAKLYQARAITLKNAYQYFSNLNDNLSAIQLQKRLH